MEEYKTKTVLSYNKHAKYHANRFSGLTDILRRSEFKHFIELLPGKYILDLGCGSGDHSLLFKQQGLEVSAIDISQEMVRLTREKGIEAEIMDIEQLTFALESFDGIWAVTSLLHIPKAALPGVIKNLHKILKHGGILYVCVKEGEGEKMVVDNADGTTERFFSFWQLEELRALFFSLFSSISFDEERVVLKGRTFLQLFFRK